MVNLTRDGDVFLLDLGDDENRFSPPWLSELDEHLERLSSMDEPRALVTHARGKIFSNGLEPERLTRSDAEKTTYLRSAHALYARLLRLPLPTVAAVQGHAFGAGAMLALAHDTRLMRAERGFWCLPEIGLGLSFTAGMTALIRARVPAATAHQAMLTGRRYGGAEAAEAGIVDQALSEDQLLVCAIKTASALAPTASPVLGEIRAGLHATVLSALEQADLFHHAPETTDRS